MCWVWVAAIVQMRVRVKPIVQTLAQKRVWMPMWIWVQVRM